MVEIHREEGKLEFNGNIGRYRVKFLFSTISVTRFSRAQRRGRA